MAHPPFQNFILRRLAPDVINRLRLRRIDLPLDREVEFPGNRIENLFFLEEGAASMTATFEDGFQVEIALAGREGVLGTSSLFGTRRSLNRVYMQINGYGYASATEIASSEFKRAGQFHDLVLQYVQAQFIQSCQTAACNARHSVEQRMARWLLLCADRIGDRILPLSHMYMADMLGVTRSSVSLVAAQLQEASLIEYSRGKIKLLDRPGLEELACECYRAVRDHINSLADMDQTFGA